MANTASHIAIVGMACRAPGASNVDELWSNLLAGIDSISRSGAAQPPGGAKGVHVAAKGVLAGADLFDAGLFGYTPAEAALMDPQHRVMLECAWEALENAGYGVPGKLRVGVYAGVAMNTYLLRNLLPHPDLVGSEGEHQILVTNDKDFVPTRISYQLDLTGPSVNVQTACSTSLVAVHVACQSLLAYQCDMAVAGGAAVTVPLEEGYVYREGGILSPDGHCRAFDEHAQGTVPGDGVGLVVLKRLDDAIEAGDVIHAVILGSAINNDGGRKVGFTAPSVAGQAAVIAEAHALAGVPAGTIGYVEAHGTGTPLGDPIEVAALTLAFRRGTATSSSCALGSIKSNVGHLDTAAGVMGLIKAVLTVKNEVIPATLHVTRANPALQLERSPFFLPSAAKPWPAGVRRAAVSAFGLGGTNAHAVIEQAPVRKPSGPSRPWAVLPLSARTPTALASASSRLASHLFEHDVELADAAFTLAVGRRELGQRRAVVASNHHDAIAALRHPAQAITAQTGLRTAFLFPGQGAQRAGMGRALYEQELVFRAALDDAAQALLAAGAPDVRELLDSEIHETAAAQPALFAIEFALTELWRSWGIEPAAVLGHSVGEFAAACVAQVLTLDEAARLVAARGRLMQSMPRGAMIAGDLQSFARDGIWISAINAPRSCVLGGEIDAIERLAREVPCDRLRTSHAFHTPMMDGMLDDFRREVASIPPRAPRVPWVSTRTGQWMRAEPVDPGYWVAQVREPVQFAAAIATLAERGLAMLELGPGSALTTLTRSQIENVVCVPALGRDESRAMAEAIATLWSAGVEIQWPRYYGNEHRQRVELPAYPFERQRYWIDPVAPRVAATPSSSTLQVPTWKSLDPLPPVAPDALRGMWFLSGDESPLRAALAQRLQITTDLANADHVLHFGAGYRSTLALAQTLAARDTPARLTIVTRGIHAVHAQDEIHAENALILGIARVLPQEHPSIRCRVIDTNAEDVAQLLAECVADDAPAVIAHRGRHRWTMTFAHIDVDAAHAREDGVYLITGGFGALGQTIARHLTSRGARVALAGRNTPNEETITLDLDSLSLLTPAAAPAFSPPGGEKVPKADEGSLEELCVSLAREVADITPRPEYQRFATFLKQIAETPIPTRPPHQIHADATTKHPQLAPVYDLLLHCGTHYRDVLTGKATALDVLYPDGKSTLIEAAVAAMSPHSSHRALARTIANSLKEASRERRLRVLEVGAGNGFLTREVAPALQNAEFHISDISHAWAASQSANGLPFGILDITRDPAAQGWREPFDVVIGLDVVHATPDLDVTLRNLRRLLVPGGVLQLIETSPPARWNTMVWGMTRDWWSYADRYRTTGPLLSADEWQTALTNCGFAQTSACEADDCALIAAQTSLEGDVLRIAADVTDERAIREAVIRTREHFGALHGVIHAAGEEHSGAFARATGDIAQSAKVRGTRALLAALHDQPLDYLLLCSSITSQLGGVGNVDYTAANAFLDAVAHERTARAFPIVSVNWDRWQGLGMAAIVEARHRERTGETLTGGLPVDRALDAFDRITAHPRHAQVVVSSMPFEEMREAASSVTIADLAERIVAVGRHPRPFLPTPFVAPRNDTEERIAEVWQETLGVDRIGVDDEFSALGGDSLIAIKVVSRLRDALGVQLRVATLFEAPTIARLAETILVADVEEGSL